MTATPEARFGLEWPCKATWTTAVWETWLEPQQLVAGQTAQVLSLQGHIWQQKQTDRLIRVPESHLTLASRRNKSPVAQLVPLAVLFLDLLPLNFPSCLREWARAVKRGVRGVTQASPHQGHPTACSSTCLNCLQTNPARRQNQIQWLVSDHSFSFMSLWQALRSTCARQGTGRTTISKDPGAGGTPAALTVLTAGEP